MKITRTATEAKILKENKYNANIGCNKCPKCGCSSPNAIPTEITWNGFFGGRNKVDCYSCHSCGCQWQSDKYNW